MVQSYNFFVVKRQKFFDSTVMDGLECDTQ